MTIAQAFKDSSIPYMEVVEQADKIAVDADQEWEKHQTVFQFADGSQLKAKFPNVLEVM